MKFAIADPPYPGQSAKHYKNHRDYAGEVDLYDLSKMLETFDAWALCTSSVGLKLVLGYCPTDVRIAAWVKPFCSFKPNVNPAYSWEPVIFKGGRKRERSEPTVRDFIAEPITLRKGLAGAKPERFCFWLFDILGAESGDEMHDLFPGTGAITDAWNKYVALKEGRPIQGAML